ncbi:uncharacterized protein LTR77_006708 [Saxophila tyrrhenica]|uniref:Flavin reductase like domain-containing protein n=1 Tax=Saxophila tyrrhenica TaxID=1690608 RepID=A0AAV9P5F2_9PEZI|nr:hypothetical protein LTR77_006708 [Saxophila tyrrhenica]
MLWTLTTIVATDGATRLSNLCGVLLSKPTIVVYAFSHSFSLQDHNLDKVSEDSISHFGTADGVEVDGASIAFMRPYTEPPSLFWGAGPCETDLRASSDPRLERRCMYHGLELTAGGVLADAVMVWEAEIVLQSRVEAGLCLDPKKWSAEDFVEYYVGYTEAVQALGLVVRPLP